MKARIVSSTGTRRSIMPWLPNIGRLRKERESTSPHPLGPLVCRTKADRPAKARALAAATLIGCSALLGVAAILVPDPSGMGTHEQLGLLPCAMPLTLGYPCPTCGMTTAFAHTVRGSFVAAFQAQPAGLVFALMTAVLGVCALSVVLTAKVWRINWYRINPMTPALLAGALVLSAWLYKIAMVVGNAPSAGLPAGSTGL